MTTYTEIVLSGSVDGRPILVAATATPGTAVHAAPSSGVDRLFIWAVNTHTADIELTIEFGGTSSPGDHIVETIPARGGALLVVQGQALKNSLAVKAFASVASKINLSGFAARTV